MRTVAPQRFLLWRTASVDDAVSRAALTRLSARLSFRDFPDFLVIVCRGDLSDIAGPSLVGAWSVPIDPSYPSGQSGDRRERAPCRDQRKCADVTNPPG